MKKREKNNCIIVGYGSAGSRHAKNARRLGFGVSLVTAQTVEGFRCYRGIAEALENERPRFAVIASETYRHIEDLTHCIKNSVPCLVEKPLAAGYAQLRALSGKLKYDPGDHRVAYCLRYHPIIREIKKELNSLGKLISAHIVFGQYLPWWRPNTDYTRSYSASAERGGGVLLDASHEIDLLTYLFGPVKKLVAVSGKFSNLRIKSDDLCLVICRMKSGQIINLSLDYINQVPDRHIAIDGEKGSIQVDLLKAGYRSFINRKRRDSKFDYERNSLFVEELSDFVFRPRSSLLPDLKEAVATLRIIEAVRRSAKERRWINL
jgi:predicted dehydrogenase